MIRTTQPLTIVGPDGDESRYVLPPGTTLYENKHFPEGFTRYVVYFNHKGVVAHEQVVMEAEHDGSYIDPLWLEDVAGD